VKPRDWPRYMEQRRLAGGASAYYWKPPTTFRQQGFSLHAEPLGQSYAAAIERAEKLNQHLDAWRTGRGAERSLEAQPGFGTLDWLIERYRRSRAWEKVSTRAQRAYADELALVTNVALKTGARAGTLALASITARAVDRLYERVRDGGRGQRHRQARVAMRRMARAWDVVRRLYPDAVPAENPWHGVETDRYTRRETVPATRDEAYALAAALAGLGHPHLGFAAIAAFEWHQRPEHLIGGVLAWTNYRPAGRPEILIRHPKTGAEVWLPLQDNEGLLFPEAEAALQALSRLGVGVVINNAKSGPARPYSPFYAKALVRRARRKAGLAEHVTLAACRHGGMTELGDAELTEQQTMSLSGHRTADAARLYVKRTAAQRVAAARKRRAWVETEQAPQHSARVDSKEAG
jgi:hypothetical protein